MKFGPSRRTFVGLTTTAVALPFARPRGRKSKEFVTCRFGINLCGTEFPEKSVPTITELDYYRSRGIYTFRLPIRWEFVQPDLMRLLDTSYVNLFRKLIDYAAKHGQRILLDIHNFGRYKDVPIGSDLVPATALVDLWTRLATLLSGHPGLKGYDIMNEPHDLPAMTTWPRVAQAVVDAIRRIDFVTPIYIEGDGWSNAKDWRDHGHLNTCLNIRDPAGKIIYSAHVYADWDKTGRYTKSFEDDGATTDILIDRFRVFHDWLQDKGFRGHVGECGVPADSGWLACLDAFVAYLSRQTDIVGMDYWAGGPAWGEYALSIEPINGADRPQMNILSKYAAPQLRAPTRF